MKKSAKILLSLFVIFLISGVFINSKVEDYDKSWVKIEKYVEEGLPKSALKIVDEIYQTAKSEGNSPQIIKSLIYRISLQSRYQDDHILKSIKYFEKELEISDNPVKQILNSLIAELYQGYYSENRWKINQRGTLENYDNNDIATWDAASFSRITKKYFLQSLEDKEFLKSIKLENYELILIEKDTSDFEIYPSLYDLLANRAIDYFTGNDGGFDEIEPLSTFDFSSGLNITSEFLKIDFTQDSLKEKEQIVFELFKDLLELHKHNKDTIASVDLELRRLQYYKDKATSSSDNDNKYLVSLFELKKEYSEDPVSVRISYEIALVYNDYGNKYERLKSEKNRWHKAKAVDMCNEALNKFAEAEYSNHCQNLVNKIKRQNFKFKLHEVEIPDKAFLGSLSFTNTSKLYLKIVKFDPDNFLKDYGGSFSMEKEIQLLKKGVLKSWTLDLPNSKDYQEHIAEFQLPALKQGFYIVFASNDSTIDKNSMISSRQIWISDLSYVLKSSENENNATMFLLNRQSGKGVSDVEITVFKRDHRSRGRKNELKKVGQIHSSKNGIATINNFENDHYGNYYYRLEKDGDILYSQEYLNFYRKHDEAPRTRIWLFTDRAIYRPGQTVYFKGIVTENIGNDYSLKENFETKLEFKNTNQKTITDKIFITNKNGSFNGEFVIPKGLLNGNFLLHTPIGRTNIRVEDYKRPTFQVEFDTLREQYKIGDFIELKGKVEDYSGSSVENAEIKFTVKRSSFMPPWRDYGIYDYYGSQDIEIENGKVKTDENGNFIIGFKALKDINLSQRKGMSYYFNINVDATDITGETQSGFMSLKLSDSYINIAVASPKIINLESGTGLTISATNSMGMGVETKAEIKVFKLIKPNYSYVSRDWQKPDVFLMGKEEFKKNFPKQIYKDEDEKEKRKKQQVFSSTILIKGNQKVFVEELNKLKPGEYLVVVSASDKTGETVEAKQYFSLYSPKSSSLAVNRALAIMLDKTTAQPGDEIILSISSSDKKSKILYEINNGEKLVERKWISISNAQKNIQIPVMEEYRGNFSVNVVMVSNNRFYSQSETILVPFKNKELKLKLETFRDYLTPGSQEEWRLTIKGQKGEKATAEILAAMYDASLDKFIANNWDMRLYHNKNQNNRWRSSMFGTNNSRFIKSAAYAYFKPPFVDYPKIDWFGYDFYGNRLVYRDEMLMSAKTGRMVEVAMPTKDLENEKDDIPATSQETIKLPPEIIEEQQMMPLRTNFSETAFFYPNLKTDAEGNTIISFKTPDALTEWKFMALAHSKDLKIGNLVQNIKARKELMVMPNVPRFVRQGDEINFTAKVVNFTEEDVLANVEIEFFDAVSMKPLNISKSALNQNLPIAAKSNAKISWLLNIPDDVSMISYRLKAKTENFSDGEERAFPVLTNRMLVTETMPMFLNANQSKTYDFKALVDKTSKSKSIKNYRYTVEVTSNPVWYAIQALPYLSESNNQSTLSAFNRYYSNSVSSYIVNSNPEIRRVFKSWKQLTPDAFLSNLQKNEELKTAVLEATPWVLEAEEETEQKRRIGVLFDINRLANEKSATLEKLISTQMPSGAWPWFNGMREDVYTTQKIALGFAKLHSKGIIHIDDDHNRRRMIKKAISFLDRKLVEDFEKLKKNYPERMKNNNLSSIKIQYLYLRALLIIEFPIGSKTQEAFSYYSRQAKRYWLKQNEYLQAMTAVSLNKLGYRNEAEAIVRSLNERSLQSEEMGMYWRQKRGWHWYEAPVETQAMLIEAFAELENNKKAIEQMKIWLLKQKQTQRWKTPSATLEAVFALLTTGDDLIVESSDVVVKVGGEKLEPEEGEIKEAGTGYFKVSWIGEEINGDIAKIELENPNNNIAWAAAYWQYFEDMDKVEASSSPLSIEKKFFVEKFTETGTVIEPLEEGQKLKTGQKLISRMIIRTDRNMEFVHLKDMRSSALEPISNISGYKYTGGLGYYENITDVSTDFFFRYLQKGTYVLEYAVFVSQSGKFSNGIATIQSMYAPEFSAHSEGIRLVVE